MFLLRTLASLTAYTALANRDEKPQRLRCIMTGCSNWPSKWSSFGQHHGVSAAMGQELYANKSTAFFDPETVSLFHGNQSWSHCKGFINFSTGNIKPISSTDLLRHSASTNPAPTRHKRRKPSKLVNSRISQGCVEHLNTPGTEISVDPEDATNSPTLLTVTQPGCYSIPPFLFMRGKWIIRCRSFADCNAQWGELCSCDFLWEENVSFSWGKWKEHENSVNKGSEKKKKKKKTCLKRIDHQTDSEDVERAKGHRPIPSLTAQQIFSDEYIEVGCNPSYGFAKFESTWYYYIWLWYEVLAVSLLARELWP